jgi:hypothetical protein
MDGEVVQARLEREPEVHVVQPLTVHDQMRLEPLSVYFHPCLNGVPASQMAQNEMSLRIPGNNRAPRPWSKDLQPAGRSHTSGRDSLQTQLADKNQKETEYDPGRHWVSMTFHM